MTSESLSLSPIPLLLTAAGAVGSRIILTRQALRMRPGKKPSWASDLRGLIKVALLVALWSTLGLYWLWLCDTQYLWLSKTVERGAHWPWEGAGPVLYWLWALAVHFLALCIVGWSGRSAARGAGRMVQSLVRSAPKRARNRKHGSDVVPFPAPRGRGDEPSPPRWPQSACGDAG